jgi:predicted Zn-dependent protease
MFTLAQGNSLEDAAQTVLKQYQLSVVDSKRETVNGLPAIVMIADQAQQQQEQGVRTMVYLIQYGSNIYNMIGASSIKDFNSYAQLFQNTMNGFRSLDDPDKINRQPKRVRIKTVQQNGTLSQALQSYRVGEKQMNELAALNGMKLNEQVQKGMLIKVIE